MREVRHVLGDLVRVLAPEAGREQRSGVAMADTPTEIPELPAERSLDRLVSLLEPLSRVIQPQLYGVEHLPADGSVLVGNHTIYGLLDVPFMMAEIWKPRRLAIRGLASTPTTQFRSGATC
jgi:hypothetical protein